MKNQRGFTLIEILITLSIIAVVGLLLFGIFGHGLSLYTAEADSAKAQTDMRTILSEISNKVRLCNLDDISVVNGKLTIKNNVYVLEDRILKRNESILAKNITSFTAKITNSILEITVKNATGSEITTSISLVQQ